MNVVSSDKDRNSGLGEVLRLWVDPEALLVSEDCLV